MLSTHHISASSVVACINILSVALCCAASFEDSNTFPGSRAGVGAGIGDWWHQWFNILVRRRPFCFLPLCHIKTASPILPILTSFKHTATVIFFPNPMLEPFILKPSYLEKAIIFKHFLTNVKKWLWESELQYFLYPNSRNR